MLNRLVLFELKIYLKQAGFWLGLLLFSALAALITSQRGSAFLYANSPFSIAQTLLFLSPNIIFLVCILATPVLLRDSQYKVESLIYTTPLDKFHYLMSRYLGLMLATLLVLLAMLVAMMLTVFFIDPKQVGPFKLHYYLSSFAIFIVPSVLLCVSIVFSTAIFTKNMLAIYVAAIVVFVLYAIGSVLGNSPVLASSSPLTSGNYGFSALLEPYGLIAFFEQSAYWNNAQKNQLEPMLSGNLLSNRLLWLAVSVSMFAYSYQRFSFKLFEEKSQKVPKENSTRTASIKTYEAVQPSHDSANFRFDIWFSKLKIEYFSLAKGKVFLVLLIVTMVFTAVHIISEILAGPMNGSQPYYASTALILESLLEPLIAFGKLVAIVYAVELYWNDRAVNFYAIVDGTPSNNLTFYLAKLTNVVAILFSLITVCILISIVFQLLRGMTDLNLPAYALLYYYAGVPILLVAFLCFFLQGFAKNKAVGLMLGIGVFCLNILWKVFSIQHPLLVFAYVPKFYFSEMADTLYHHEAFHWYSAYWLSFGGILGLLTVKYWRRGEHLIFASWSRGSRSLLIGFIMSFVGIGAYVFYQTNVLNTYTNAKDKLTWMEQYEKTYTQFKDLPQPTTVSVKLDLDLYPEKRSYQVKGQLQIVNQTEQAISKVLVSVLKQPYMAQSVQLQGAKLLSYDSVYQAYWFELEKAMQVQESRSVDFSLAVTHNAFSKLDGEHWVTKGGSYIELEDVLPQFGFNQRYMISDEQERIKRGLPGSKLPVPTAQDQLLQDDNVQFEATVSTSISSKQTMVTVGQLQKEWQEGERRFFHYKTTHKVAPQLAVISADFALKKAQHEGVEIQIYRSPKHDKDDALILDALKQTMDYFATNLQAYSEKQFTVVELPYFAKAQSFGSAQPGMYLGVENRFFNLDNRRAEKNPLLSGVSHEFAHQFWGNAITPNYLGGYTMLTEVLCKYTELVMQKKLYGGAANLDVIHQAIDRYLRERPYSRNTERPLFSVGMEPHVYYNKGQHSMYALMNLIGEEKINQALRNLLRDFSYPRKPTSLDLLNELYKLADKSQIPVINDLFKRVVFHDFTIHQAKIKKLANGEYETSLDLSAQKFVLNQSKNKEEKERINEEIEVGLFSGSPSSNKDNVITIEKFLLNQERNVIVLRSRERPQFVQVDPSRLRIDRTPSDNVFKIEGNAISN
nr:M1 family aminopeptidase [uncultured Undibacterium sp.]